MQKDELNTIKFAAMVCLACSVSLAGVRTMLLPIQTRNQEIDRQVNILKALFPDFDPQGNPLDDDRRDELFTQGRINRGTTRDWITQYFENFVTVEDTSAGPLYILSRDGQPVAYAFPAEGKGLWSTVHSFIGLEADLATIRGITFFDHGETPGLGGECSKPWFQRNFRGQALWKDGAPVTLEVVKGPNADPNSRTQVDGMSGATITGNGIQRFVNSVFRAYNEAVFNDLRAAKNADESTLETQAQTPTHSPEGAASHG